MVSGGGVPGCGAGCVTGESRKNGDISYRPVFSCFAPFLMALFDERSEEFAPCWKKHGKTGGLEISHF